MKSLFFVIHIAAASLSVTFTMQIVQDTNAILNIMK